jgi:rubrerythrin
MREPLLGRDPDIDSVSMAMLVGIASTIERDSVRRYEALATGMQRRGDFATAAAFRLMLDEERVHVGAVERWAASLDQPVPPEGQFPWHVPDDFSRPWDEIAGSARLTPYRAFALAVDSEQRAFALYSYLAAHAEDARVEAEAEKLAMEELRHAGLMRRWRRQAWHRERRGARDDALPVIASPGALHEFLGRREAGIAARHRALAARLRAAGDEDSAQVLEQLLQRPTWPPAADASRAQVRHEDPPASDEPAHLLVAAQEPLEALSEVLEATMRTTEGELFAEVESALANVVARMARIASQATRRMQAA